MWEFIEAYRDKNNIKVKEKVRELKRHFKQNHN